MRRLKHTGSFVALLLFTLFIASSPSFAENEGLEDLDRATQQKVTVEGLEDLNDVIDSIDTALEKGLDEANTEFAEQLLVSTLMQRASTLSSAVLNSPLQDSRRGQWMQLRQFALNDLQRVVEIDDKVWEAYLLISRLQTLPFGDAGAAKRALTKVVDAPDITPEQRAEALGLRGTVQRDEEKRLADFNRAIELEPKNPDFLRLRAQHYLSAEEFDKALVDIDKAIELDPEHAASHELRGMILLGLERQDDALASFNRATELVPEAALPYQHRGELYLKKGDAKKALEQLTKALELSPENLQTLLVRASVYYELKEVDKALADVETVIRLQPNAVIAHLMRAEILAASDRLDDAIAALEELNKRAPEQAQLLSPLGTYYLLDGRPRKAIETFSEVVTLAPDDARALRFRGDAYLNIGKHQEAIADFNRALELEGDNEGVLNNLAWVLATSPVDALRDGQRAIELATKASELAGGQTPHILSTLAAAYAEVGNFEKAKEWATKAIELQQSAVDVATDPAEKKRRETDLASLKKELENYQQNKPTREIQSVEEEGQAPPKADQTAAP